MKLSAAFAHAQELGVEARQSYLKALAGEDPELAQKLEALLLAEPQSTLPEPEQTWGDIAAFAHQHHGKIGSFTLLKMLGHGGMGDVWLAERMAGPTRQRVALKLLRREFIGRENETQRRFLDEQRIVATLEHPFIARLVDAGDEQGVPWLAMEYVEGEAITDWCDRQQLSVKQRVQLCIHVLEAVQHAHQHLIVHRDLKPSNILVSTQGIPKLLDFGIAKRLLNTSETATAQRFFSLSAVAPEQWQGGRITVATDIYQLGVLFYELLSGSPPYAVNAALDEVQNQILHGTPELPSVVASDQSARERGLERGDQLTRVLAGDLDRIVLHALRKNPAERYQSVLELSDDLKAWLEQRPVRASGQGRWYRARKFFRRHVFATSAAILVVIGALAFMVTLLQRDVELRQARSEALAARDEATVDRDKSRAVNRFLLDMFRSADPTAQGQYDLKQILLNAIQVQLRSDELATDASTLFVLIDAAMGIGAEPEARALLDQLAPQVPTLTLHDRRALLLLRAKSANLARDRTLLDALIGEMAPLMQSAPDEQRHLYLAYLGQSLMETDPMRVLAETDIKPVPPPLIRLRSRAFRALGLPKEALGLLEEARGRNDLGPMEQLAVLESLSITYRELGRNSEALSVAKELLARAEDVLGRDNSRALSFRNTYAKALAASGDIAAAVAALDAMLADPKLPDGMRTPTTLNRVSYAGLLPFDERNQRLIDQMWQEQSAMSEGARSVLFVAILRAGEGSALSLERARTLEREGVTRDPQELGLQIWREWLLADPQERQRRHSDWLRRAQQLPVSDHKLEGVLRSSWLP